MEKGIIIKIIILIIKAWYGIYLIIKKSKR